jgi:hypothetical protein
MTVTFSLSVYERRNPRNVVECIYLVGRGKGASAHSQLEWALTALVEEMGDMKKTQVVFSEQTYVHYDRTDDEQAGYGLELHRPFTAEERKQIWDGICRRLPKKKA